MQRFTPMLSYDDAAAALGFLADAFGFEEVMRMEMPDGSIGHAEMALGGQMIMLAGSWDISGMVSPLRLDGIHGQIYCIVDDVDAHYARATAGGAIVVGAPAESHGARAYRAMDPEGHHWIFATPHTNEEQAS